MAEQRSVFYDEWRDCLHSHYLYVLETNDNITEPTLRNVLVEAGVEPELVDEWRWEAAERFGLDDLKAELIEYMAEPIGDEPSSEAVYEEELIIEEPSVKDEFEPEPMVEPVEPTQSIETVIEDAESDFLDDDIEETISDFHDEGFDDEEPPQPISGAQLSLF